MSMFRTGDNNVQIASRGIQQNHWFSLVSLFICFAHPCHVCNASSAHTKRATWAFKLCNSKHLRLYIACRKYVPNTNHCSLYKPRRNICIKSTNYKGLNPRLTHWPKQCLASVTAPVKQWDWGYHHDRQCAPEAVQMCFTDQVQKKTNSSVLIDHN